MTDHIIRMAKNREHPYTVISNALLEDSRLSFGARGLMAYLLSKPDHWEVRMDDLIAQSPAGRQATQTMVAELLKRGYLTRQKLQDAQGHWRVVTTVHEEPVPVDEEQPTGAGQTVDGATVDGLPVHGEPVRVVSTDLASTDVRREDEASSQAALGAPVAVLVSAEERRVKAVRTAAREYFEHETGLRIPKRGSKSGLGKLWWNPIQRICDLCGNDLEDTKHLIALALARMREGRLTIANPNSILNTAIAIDAERRRPGRERDSAGGVIPRMTAWG